MDTWAPTAILVIAAIVVAGVAAASLIRRAQARTLRRQIAAGRDTARLQPASEAIRSSWPAPAVASEREPDRALVLEEAYDAYEEASEDAFFGDAPADSFEDASAGRADAVSVSGPREDCAGALPPVAPLPSLQSLPALPPLAAGAPGPRSSRPRTPKPRAY